MHRQFVDRHPDRNIDSLIRIFGIRSCIFFSRTRSKFSPYLFGQEIQLFALLTHLDLGYFLLKNYVYAKFFHCLPDGGLLRRFPLVHAATRKDQVIQAGAVTLDQRYFVPLN